MDEQERVEYSFTGDVSSLREATQQAISLLDKYEKTVKDLAASGNLDVGKTAFSGFQRTVNGVIKQVNTLSSYMSKASADSQQAFTPDTSIAVSAYKNIADALAFLRSSSKVTTDDLKLVTEVLKEARTTLDPVTSKAMALGTSFVKVSQIADQSMTKVTNAVDNTSQHVAADTETLGQKWDNYVNRMSKSAEMSAQVFERAGRFTGFMTGVDTAVSRAVLMREKINDIVTSMTNRIKTMATAFDPWNAKLSSYRDKTINIMNQVKMALNSVSSAFRRVTQSTDSSEAEANQATAAHQKLASSAQQLASTVKSETSSISKEKKALESKNKTLQQSSSQHNSLSSIINHLGAMFTSETTNINNFTASLQRAAKGSNLLRKALSRLSAVQIGKWFAAAVKESISYVENLNLFTVAMGDSVEEGREFVATMSEIYGLDPSNLYRYAGYFNQLTDAIGMTSEASSSISLSLTKAAADISSLFNVDIETVVDDLASGMQGMSRSVRKYGMDIRATTLQQTALTYGLTQQVETMSEADRMALRYLTMMQQAQNAIDQTTTSVDGATDSIGDFARNIETPANQLRIFKEQVTQLGRAIGNFFIPMLRAVLPWINGIVMALRTVLEVLASLFGFTTEVSHSLSSGAGGVEDLKDTVDAVGSSAEASTKKIKEMLAPFDELNVMPDPKVDTDTDAAISLDGSLNPVLLDALKEMDLDLDNIRMKANEIRDRVLEFLGFEKVTIFDPETGEYVEKLIWLSDKLKANLIDMFPQWEKTITALFENWTAIMESLKHVWESVLGVIEKVFEKLRSLVSKLGLDDTFAEFIESLAGSLERLSAWIDGNSNSIANFVGLLVGLKLGFKGLSIVTSLIKPVAAFLSTVGGAISGFGTVIAVIAGVIGAIAVLYNSSETFATAFDQFIQTFWTGLKPMVESVVSLFTTLWESLQRLWAEHIQPMLGQVGEFFALVLGTIGSLWENVSSIFSSVVSGFETAWITVLEPVFGAFFDAVGGLIEIFSTLWENIIDPVLKYIGDGLQRLWTQYLQPIVEDAIAIIGGVIEIVLHLWNSVLQPLINWIAAVFGPMFAAVFEGVWLTVATAVEFIASLIRTLMDILKYLVEFIAGTLAADWKRAISSLGNAFVSLANGILTVFEIIINYLTDALNVLIQNFLKAIENLVQAVNDVLSYLGMEIQIRIDFSGFPRLKRVELPRVPEIQMASGGVVTGPTQALIGEGRYDEAVIPLGNSPQMKDLVNQIAEATNNKSENDQIPVQIFLDGDVLFEAMVERARASKIRTGESAL